MFEYKEEAMINLQGIKRICLVFALLGFWVTTFPLAAGNSLIVGIQNRPKTMDPRFSTDATGMRISHHLLFSTLVQHDQDLRIIPGLAKRWETPDDKTYLFYLRKGVKFHDGEPLTADDVKFTFEHLKDPQTRSPFAGTYKVIEEIEVIDPHTVKFELKEVVASFLTSVIMPIVPKHLLTSGASFPDRLIGSGPFQFESQSPNEIVLKKNPDYFMGEPRLDRVVFKVINDDNTRFLKMRKGELDLVINAIALKRVDDFKKRPLNIRYNVIEEPGLSYNYINFNMMSKAVQDVKVRQAIAYGINVDEIIKYRLEGHAVPSNSLLSPVNWFSEEEAKRYPHNIDKARTLLNQAGLKDPDGDGPQPRLTLELKTSNNAEVIGIARILQAQLKKIGVNVDLKSYEWGTFYGDIKSGNFQMTTMRWVGITEPDFYYNLFHSGQFPPAGRNRGRYTNKTIDQLTEKGRQVLDPEKRKEIYSEVQKILARELPYINLWHTNNISIVHKRVSGYEQHPTGGFLSFWKIAVN